jgi:hypothetical protein
VLGTPPGSNEREAPMSTARIAIVTALCLPILASRAPGGDAGSAPQEDAALVQKLLVQGEDASRRWINGDSTGYANLMVHTDRLTIFGPLGGPSPMGWNDRFARAQVAGARQFQGGILSTVELVQSYVSDSLVVVVKIERNKVRVAGRNQPEEWDERSTEVYAREGLDWKIVHRHSDPLTERRTLDQTLELLHR